MIQFAIEREIFEAGRATSLDVGIEIPAGGPGKRYL
jgi:hypothetical protein